MGDHIVDGAFQSNKYPTCPRGKVPLSIRDVTAQDLLWEYSQRRCSVDTGFSEDLESCLRAAGFVPGQTTAAERAQTTVTRIQQALTAAFRAGVEYGEGWIEPPDAETEATVYAADRVTSVLGPLAPTGPERGSPVLSAEEQEQEALRAVRRLVAVTSKSCNQRQEYNAQIALLDRLLRVSLLRARQPGYSSTRVSSVSVR